MEYYHCSKCGRNLDKSEMFPQAIKLPMVFDGKDITIPWGISSPGTAEYCCRKHNIPVEIKNK